VWKAPNNSHNGVKLKVRPPGKKVQLIISGYNGKLELGNCWHWVWPPFVAEGPATVATPPANRCGPYWPHSVALGKSIELIAAYC